MSENKLDIIMRTKDSAEMLKLSLDSILQEIPVRKVIIVDGGSVDDTIKIASQYREVEIHVKPELNLGQATKFGFSIAKTEWVAVIDSDVVLKKGWFSEMSRYMDLSDAVEGCRIDYYRLKVIRNFTKVRYGVFGQTLIRRKYLQDEDLDTPYGEDAAIKYHFDENGLRWKKVENYLAEHYPKFDTDIYNVYRRTGTLIGTVPRYIPKRQQIGEGHVHRRYKMMTFKQVIWNTFIRNILREPYIAFRTRIWFVLAYLGLI
jgi:glycosyltransferase involved in cell wall biosynthesis